MMTYSVSNQSFWIVDTHKSYEEKVNKQKL